MFGKISSLQATNTSANEEDLPCAPDCDSVNRAEHYHTHKLTYDHAALNSNRMVTRTRTFACTHSRSKLSHTMQPSALCKQGLKQTDAFTL